MPQQYSFQATPAASLRDWLQLLRGRPRLLLLADLLIAGLLLIFPFIMGGREAWGHAFLITGTLALAIAWSLHCVVSGRRLRLSGLEIFLLAGALLVWLQIYPLSSEQLARVSPETVRLTDGWTTVMAGSPNQTSETPMAWNRISFVPAETRHALWMFASYAIFAVILIQRLESRDDCERLLKLIAVSGLAMAAFAFLQLLTSNGRFFWFYDHPYTDTHELLKGAFTNRNHFAQFLALSVGPILWWITYQPGDSGRPRKKRAQERSSFQSGPISLTGSVSPVAITLLIGLATVVLSILLSLSRGGMLACGVAGTVAVFGLWRGRRVGTGLAGAIVVCGVLVLVGLATLGQDRVQDRLDTLASGEADQIDTEGGRRTIWTADFQAVKAFPLLGTGVGSHQEIYPTYMESPEGFGSFEFSHAESSYLQLALETGLIGLGLAIAVLLIVGLRSLLSMLRHPSHSQRAAVAAAAAGISGGCLHAVADFIWYVPAIVVVTIALMVIAWKMSGRLSGEAPSGLPVFRLLWLAPGLLAALALVQVQPELSRRIAGEHHWYEYLRLTFSEQEAEALAASGNASPQISSSIPLTGLSEEQNGTAPSLADYDSNTPALSPSPPEQSWMPVQTAEEQAAFRKRRREQRLQALKDCVAAQPTHHRARLMMAVRCLEMFEDRQAEGSMQLSLAQIRDTVSASQFESLEATHNWLNRAFPDTISLPIVANRLLFSSLALCPVQGKAYLNLLDCNFLSDHGDSLRSTILQQALTVREHDPRTQFVAGREAFFAGQPSETLEHWQHVFHAGTDFRKSIVRILGNGTPAAFFIVQFKPISHELLDVLEVYEELGRVDQLPPIRYALADTASREARQEQNPLEKVRLLMMAYNAIYPLGETARSEELLREAVATDETAYWPQYGLALLLHSQGRFEEALVHFRRCYEQRPNDPKLERLIYNSREKALTGEVPVLPTSFGRETPTDALENLSDNASDGLPADTRRDDRNTLSLPSAGNGSAAGPGSSPFDPAFRGLP